VRGLVLTLHDITERRALEERLKHLAFHDSLTQLPNRALFLDRVEHALARRGRHRERLAVMLIDLDDFKLVNDTRGHAAGDALLVNVTERITHALRPEDTCARLGGDEFAVLVEGLVSDDEAGQLAERILTSLRRPYGQGDDELTVRASIGLSTSDYGADAAELLMQADLAMYAAKDAGKGTQELYRPSLQHVMQSRLTKLRDLQRAMDDHQFLLHHQPILHLPSGRVVGTEALLRWQHPEHGLVLPGEFIDVVEGGDLAVPLGRWVIETAIAQAATWQPLEGDGEPIRLSVNVAPRQLADPDFVDYVEHALDLHGLSPSGLVLEITERTLTVQEPQIVSSMQRLSRLGVGLAVDDFGTGYAALGYLRRFPVTTLKIDRSFVSGVDTSTDDRALVAAIIRLGETLNLSLVAEGIETVDQRDALIALGCTQGQGFLYARALPPEELSAYISTQSATGADHTYLALTAQA
jgi:diguanylate cyclase (GGDEF)-like protein